MPQTPHSAPSQSLLKPANKAPKRSLNIYESIHANDEVWKVFEPCAYREDEAFEVIYVVEMEIVSQTTGNHFDVCVVIHWESFYGPDEPAPADVLFGVARNLLREHLEDCYYPPRFSGRGINLRWPELDEYDGTV